MDTFPVDRSVDRTKLESPDHGMGGNSGTASPKIWPGSDSPTTRLSDGEPPMFDDVGSIELCFEIPKRVHR